ncbi:MAG: B12-binding domain-containing radical SAM protein [Candidatus Heimdallarchaeaceae archaeon]
MLAYLVSPNERKYLADAGDRQPLGILYLSSALTANGINNKCFDLNHTPWLDFISKVKEEKPDIVGLSIVSSPSYTQMKRLANEVRPYTGMIIAGGFHMTARPKSLDGIVDAVVVGDGERGILKAIEKGKGIINEPIDVNEYPIPDRSKLDTSLYNMELLGLKIEGMVTARGCPYSCAFCGNPHKTLVFRDSKNIEKEAEQLKKIGCKAIYFYNESHTINREHAEKVGKVMERNKIRYRLETRCDLIDEDMAIMLSKTGCMLVALGIESGDDKVLEAIDKKTTVQKCRDAVRVLAKHGVPTKGYFMFGLPQQDLHSGLKTIKFVRELRKIGMIMADFYVLTPYPGSPIAENPEKYGVKILHHDYKKYTHATKYVPTPVIETNWLSQFGIKNLIRRARLEWGRK